MNKDINVNCYFFLRKDWYLFAASHWIKKKLTKSFILPQPAIKIYISHLEKIWYIFIKIIEANIVGGSRTRLFLSSPKCLVSLTPKLIKSVSNDESEPLEPAYFTCDASTCEIFKLSN